MRKTLRRSPAIGLALLALVGLALAALDWSHLGVSWTHIRTALGESLIVAAALGFTVDFFYKRELARDAFAASLGYLLPDELKAELRWIYGQHLICVEHEQRIVLRPLDEPGGDRPRRVRVEFEVWRTMRNVSNEPVELPTYSSVEEWFRGDPSQIELLECIRGRHHDSRVTLATLGTNGDGGGSTDLRPSQMDIDHPGLELRLAKRVMLGPGEEATLRTRGHEVHYDSGVVHHIYGAPTCRPAITVEAPPDLRAVVAFANRGRTHTTEMGDRHVLPNVLLPFQPIAVRWWPAAKQEEWERAGFSGRARAAGG